MSGDQYRLDSGMYGLGGETGSAVEGSMGTVSYTHLEVAADLYVMELLGKSAMIPYGTTLILSLIHI